MTSKNEILWRDMVICNELGLHARSAALLAKSAQQASGSVWLEKDGARVDATQVIDILTLAAACGDKIRIGVDNASDAVVLDRIASLVKKGFGE